MQKNPAYTKAFAESLPKAYAKSFDWAAIAVHGDIAAHRQPGHVGIGPCFAPRFPGTALCVVADDRPGLLATISSAFVREHLDVIGAEAYTRKTSDGRREAVDIFWIQRLHNGDPRRPLSAEELRHLEATLDACILDNLSPSNVRLPTQPPPPPRAGATETVVRFIEDRDGMLGTLEVETDDRAGMLLVLSRALYEQKVQIVSSQVRTEAGRVRDRFEVTELDDQPIRPERRLTLQVSVMNAVQNAFER